MEKIILGLVGMAVAISFPLHSLQAAFFTQEKKLKSLPDLVESIAPGVVNLQVTSNPSKEVLPWGAELDDLFKYFGLPNTMFPRQVRPEKLDARGSGFVIDETGYVVTNAHVVAYADTIVAILHNEVRLKAKLIGKDSKYDIALLKVEPNQNFRPLPLGDSDKIRIAEEVIAIGNPFGLQNTVTKGIISAKHRTIGFGPFDDFIQTDAAINPGNSGGPMFNRKGEVIGVNAANQRSGQGIGFAIPINTVKNIEPDLKKYGRVLRQWLGIVGGSVTNYVDESALGIAEGVLVANLIKDGPASRAGVKFGDVIMGADGETIKTKYDLQKMIEKNKGSKIPRKIVLKIFRDRKEILKHVQLEIVPKDEELPPGYDYI
ncbi:MAG: trypsin-like peptidase domain-containing protein [Deltaproteobacteria bacterium]|nr:trypsin-like peptidase domain-containing protein [Deltaproteobacteria bacterium]